MFAGFFSRTKNKKYYISVEGNMVITYTGKQMEISDEMKAYLEKRLKKIKFYFDQILNIKVTMQMQRGKYTAEVKVAANRDVYYAEMTDSDWKKTFDKVTDKIEKEVKKKKDKITDHRKNKKPAVDSQD